MLSVLLTDDAEMRLLNRAFRGQDRTTDVLSFAQQDEGHFQQEGDVGPAARLLGDIVVSLEQAARQAPPGDLEGELLRLLVHGLCHLRGHDHLTPRERAVMRAEEQRLLALLGHASSREA